MFQILKIKIYKKYKVNLINLNRVKNQKTWYYYYYKAKKYFVKNLTKLINYNIFLYKNQIFKLYEKVRKTVIKYVYVKYKDIVIIIEEY